MKLYFTTTKYEMFMFAAPKPIGRRTRRPGVDRKPRQACTFPYIKLPKVFQKQHQNWSCYYKKHIFKLFTEKISYHTFQFWCNP